MARATAISSAGGGSPPSPRPRVAVADDDRDIRDYLLEALPRLGYEVVGAATTGRQLVDLAAATRPDLVITDIKMPDMDGIDAARELNRAAPVPVVLLSAHSDTEMVQRSVGEHILAYLIKPVSEADLKTALPVALQRHRQQQALADEAAGLRKSLEERKLIERSKGILMRRLRIDEEDAFRRLRLLASSQNRKLVEVARQIIEADQVFDQLEEIGSSGRGAEHGP